MSDPFIPDSKEHPPEETASRPVVVYEKSAGHLAVNDALQPLAESGLVYQRSNKLVQVICSQYLPLHGQITRPEDAPVIAPVQRSHLWEILSSCACWTKYDGRSKKFVNTEPPPFVIGALHTRGHWGPVPDLRGLSTVPILRPSGHIHYEQGYDEESGLFYAPNCPKPIIPGSPTRESVQDDIARLLEVIQDFPFVEGYHRSAWLSTVFSVIARPAFDNEGGIPLLMIDANTPGTGKSLLADAASILATGMEAARSPYVAEDDELRKRITAHLDAGDQMALIDNVPAGKTVGWPSLDSALTAGSWSDRELGKSRLIRAPMKTVWVVTGNNLRIRADAARRVLKIRLEAHEANPEYRTGFKWEPLKQRIREERPWLIGAALNTVRAYLLAGQPDVGLPGVGSFEGWNRVIRSSMVWAGLPDPAQALASEEYGLDEEAEAHINLMAGWRDLEILAEGLSSSQILAQLERRKSDFEGMIEAIQTLCPTRDGSLPSAVRLGKMLRGLIGRIRNVNGQGMKIIQKRDRTKKGLWNIHVGKCIQMTLEDKTPENTSCTPCNDNFMKDEVQEVKEVNGVFHLNAKKCHFYNDNTGTPGETPPQPTAPPAPDYGMEIEGQYDFTDAPGASYEEVFGEEVSDYEINEDFGDNGDGKEEDSKEELPWYLDEGGDSSGDEEREEEDGDPFGG